MSMHTTLLSAAVLFALAACQPQSGDARASAAGEDDPLLVQDEADQDEHEHDDHDGHDHDEDDGEDDGDADDGDAVASSPANVTEQADEAADDALLDTRHGGNPLVNSPVAPIEPIAQDDTEADEDDDGE